MSVASVRILGFVLFAFLAMVAAARADEASDLVAKNLAARGGADKLAAITSLEFTGKIVEPGDFQLAYKATRARKNGSTRIEASLQGLTLVQGYDGNVGWRINPFEGRRDAERMSNDATHELADQASIDGPLLSAKARGATVTYLGREDFEGTDAYKLRIVEPSGVQYVSFLDPDTYLEIRTEETRVLRGAKHVTLSQFADYERVDGVYFPFAIESGDLGSGPADRQKVIVDHARANVPADDVLFTLPTTAGTK